MTTSALVLGVWACLCGPGWPDTDPPKNPAGLAGSIRPSGGVVHQGRLLGRDSTLTLYIDGTLVGKATSAALAQRGNRIAFGMSVYGSPLMIGAVRVIEGAE